VDVGDGGEPIDLARLDATVGPMIKEAGDIALRSFRSALVAEDKGGTRGYDPVTEADRRTESYLRRELAALFPQVEIVGEEGGTTGIAGPTRWVIDPIDGTKAYLSGLPLWGVLIGLEVRGQPLAGWCRQPYLDETFVGIAGEGWVERAGHRRSLRASATTDLASASMYTTHPSMFEAAWEQAAFTRLAERVRLQRFGGDCYLYCMLALGHIDLVVEASLQPYDIVPLIPIVEAAGGVITGPDGERPVDGGFTIAAATPQLHSQALEIAAAAHSQPTMTGEV
jgi:myo-inositol-1(or 4)-monophosphatase